MCVTSCGGPVSERLCGYTAFETVSERSQTTSGGGPTKTLSERFWTTFGSAVVVTPKVNRSETVLRTLLTFGVNGVLDLLDEAKINHLMLS